MCTLLVCGRKKGEEEEENMNVKKAKICKSSKSEFKFKVQFQSEVKNMLQTFWLFSVHRILRLTSV
jgi:hypothetical protein